MKMIMAVLRSILKSCYKRQKEYVKTMVVEPEAVQCFERFSYLGGGRDRW